MIGKIYLFKTHPAESADKVIPRSFRPPGNVALINQGMFLSFPSCQLLPSSVLKVRFPGYWLRSTERRRLRLRSHQ